MKKIVITIQLVLLCLVSIGQDFHVSQYENADMYINPALTGQNLRSDMDYRASSIYRSQWSSIASKSFSTSYLAYDQKFKEKWGLGAYLINNQASSSTYRTFNFMLSGSYNIMHESNNKHILTTGLQLGLMNKSLSPQNLTFDEQYTSSSGTFDQSLATGENLQSTSIYQLDAAWGIFYKFNPPGENYHPFIGFSFSHISLPSQNFTEDDIVMPIHWKVNLGVDWDINDELTINPSLLYMYQKGATEYILNVNGIYSLENEDYDIRAKLGYRLKDAFIIGLGMRYKDFIGMMSYDYNTSYLNNFTGGNGGFEISIGYQGAFKQTKSASSID